MRSLRRGTPGTTCSVCTRQPRVPQLNGAPGHIDRHRRRSPTCGRLRNCRESLDARSNRVRSARPAEMQTRHVHAPQRPAITAAAPPARPSGSLTCDESILTYSSASADHGQAVSDSPPGHRASRSLPSRGSRYVQQLVRSSVKKPGHLGQQRSALRRCWLLDTRLSVGVRTFLQLNRPFPCPGGWPAGGARVSRPRSAAARRPGEGDRCAPAGEGGRGVRLTDAGRLLSQLAASCWGLPPRPRVRTWRRWPGQSGHGARWRPVPEPTI